MGWLEDELGFLIFGAASNSGPRSLQPNMSFPWRFLPMAKSWPQERVSLAHTSTCGKSPPENLLENSGATDPGSVPRYFGPTVKNWLRAARTKQHGFGISRLNAASEFCAVIVRRSGVWRCCQMPERWLAAPRTAQLA